MDFVDLKTQYRLLKPVIDGRIARVLEHGQYVLGPEVAELEHALAEYTSVRFCVAVSSGTDALVLALMALGIGSGDEVVTTPFSFFATVEAIALLGARPVFADIDPHTWNLDAEAVAGAISARTKAIVAVDLYGQSADYDAINAVAQAHGLPVVEDAAQSFGATYRGRRTCGLATIGCTSFFPSKPLGCYGDAGACFTNDEALAERLRELRVHGQPARYRHTRIGMNGRMDSIQAAVLLAKLESFDAEVSARARIGRRYSQCIGALPVAGSLKLPVVVEGNTSVFAQYTIEVPDRDAVVRRMAEAGIPTAVHYPKPLHLQPALAYLGAARGQFPVAERAAGRVVSLPMHPYLDEPTQDRVIAALAGALGVTAGAGVA